MTMPYRKQVLAWLSDGAWHQAREFAHPIFPDQGLGAFVRILRAEGHAIEQRGEGPTRAYRLRQSGEEISGA